MMRLLVLMSACALFHAVPAFAEEELACNAPAGTANLLARPERFLIFGEMHGTVEGPKYFAEIVCEAAKAGPLSVGIEFPEKLQPALDAYFSSTGGEAATATFHTAFLPFDYGDGRGSVAMLQMIERLQALKQAGAEIRVTAFIPPDRYDPNETDPTQTPYEKGMARGVQAATAGQRIVVLVGNIHAMRSPIDDFQPMGMHLPVGDTLSFNLTSSGGEAWNCMSECGPNPMRAKTDGPPRVYLLDTPENGFDGEWHIGHSTAAKPAKQITAQPSP